MGTVPLPLHFLEESQLDSPGAWHPDLARASHFLPFPHFSSLLVCFFFFFFSIGKNRKYRASSPGLPSKGCTHHIENISRKEKHTPPLESMALSAHPTPTPGPPILAPTYPQEPQRSVGLHHSLSHSNTQANFNPTENFIHNTGEMVQHVGNVPTNLTT